MDHLNIKSERVRLGITTEQLAQKVGVHTNTVRLWERGETVPDGKNLVRLSRLFQCSPDYLLDLTEERTGVSR
jgi:transcriptional regulator with XRE-family HTH domain